MNDFNPRPDEARSAAIRAMIVDNAARSEKAPRPARRALTVVAFSLAAVLVVGGTSALLSGNVRLGARNGPVAVPTDGQTPNGWAGPGSSTSATPTPTSTPSAGTSTPPPTPTIADLDTVVLRADGFHFERGLESLGTASTSSTSAAVAKLTTALGTPTVTTTAAGANANCTPATTVYEWGGGALRLVDRTPAADEFDAYTVRILKSSLTTGSGADISLEGPDGVQVGQNIAAKMEAGTDLTKSQYQAPDGTIGGTLVVEPNASGTGGVGVFTSDDIVTIIGSPIDIDGGDC